MSSVGTSGLLALIASGILESPEVPGNWSGAYLRTIEDRVQRRETQLERVDGVSLGRVIPDAGQILIGSGRHLHLAVLFLDICGFSDWPSSNHDEQKAVLRVLNIFMAEMLNIIRDFGGTFEKNTGDGLMAYFGNTAAELREAACAAVYSSAVMHYVNDFLLTPWLRENGYMPVSFRVGVDCGELTLARVGIPNLSDQIVAIGSHANIACKLMKLIPSGGIAVGNNIRNHLTEKWQRRTNLLPLTGFFYVVSRQAYTGWEITHRLSKPL